MANETLNQQLVMCIDAVSKIADLWQNSDDDARNGLAHSLFEEIIYALDKEQIVDFRLKAWAEQFLVLRGQQSRLLKVLVESEPF